MKKYSALFLVSLVASSAMAKNYIVLFKQSEVSLSSMDHGAFQNLLQGSNEKSVGQLKEWLGQRRAATEVKSLWLIRGAVVDLNESTAKSLKQEPWVSGIYEDKVRRLINPVPQLVVGNSLKELEARYRTWGLLRIGVPQLRKEFPEINGSGIRVGILDTGIQNKHPELPQTILFKDFVNGIKLPYDDHGHGTHVAGTISGKQVGIAPNVKLIVGKIFGAAGSGSDSTILSAMQWMFDPDNNSATNDFPQLVSNSWGGELFPEIITYDVAEFLPYQLALQTWIHGGIIPVFAAGNSGSHPNGFPGGLPEPIAVGALDPADVIAEFSSRGPNIWKMGNMVLSVMKPDISAPGVEVTSAFPGNRYATWSGTSMATPHVSGTIALMLQANPKLNFAAVKDVLLRSSERKADTSFGYGILNAYEAVKLSQSRR